MGKGDWIGGWERDYKFSRKARKDGQCCSEEWLFARSASSLRSLREITYPQRTQRDIFILQLYTLGLSMTRFYIEDSIRDPLFLWQLDNAHWHGLHDSPSGAENLLPGSAQQADLHVKPSSLNCSN